MSTVRFFLGRAAKVLVVGTYLFLGVSLVLKAFGLIGAGSIMAQWSDLWAVFAACMWLGIGVLFFEETPDRRPVLPDREHERMARHIRRIMELLEEEKQAEALDLLTMVLEEFGDRLHERKVW